MTIKIFSYISCCILLQISIKGFATNYTVSTKAELQTRMIAALPGDTVFVMNGTYNNWGQIIFNNTNGNAGSETIVLKAQSPGGVIFTGNAYLMFRGTRIVVDGFTFSNGSAGTNAVVSFRSSSSNLSHHSRITNITIDNYNSIPATIENEWVGLYGTNNRVDHCTFINKNNARATVVVWYATNVTYPAPSVSTFHRIDSNYFKGRSFMGENGGETIRVGTSSTSRTDGYNIIEYNLFEDCTQTEPEIISSKSDFNTYRYNTIRNSTGGITLRHGRYNDVFGNFFIVDNPAITGAYGIRVIDKGHRIFNNYIENVNGNASGGTSQLRAPINLMNGVTTDTTDASVANTYFPADSCLVAFNTIVNARGGGGIVLGGTVSGTTQINPTGIVLANNVVKMTTGSALYRNPNNTSLPFSSEGNLFQAPSGLGTTASGWQSATLDFGARANGILTAPSLVQDAAVNTAIYSTLLSLFDDVQGQQRSAIFDVGADELNGVGQVLRWPLSANEVGAGTSVLLPVMLTSFYAKANGRNVLLSWIVSSEINMYTYEIQFSTGVNSFEKIGAVTARNSISSSSYSFTHTPPVAGKLYYRLKMIDKDGSFAYSPLRVVDLSKNVSIQVYPNPATSYLQVDFSNASLVIKEIIITDVAGKTYKRIAVSSPATLHRIALDGLADGTYFLRLIDENNIAHPYKFVIKK